MKILITLVSVFSMFFSNEIFSQKHTITATVVNVTSDTGMVYFSLYDKENFRVKPLQSKVTEVKNGKSTVTFANVEAGKYAILCYHDKNNNRKMDFDAYGMPLENYGASNNVMVMGPPQYDDAEFVVANKDVSLAIKF